MPFYRPAVYNPNGLVEKASAGAVPNVGIRPVNIAPDAALQLTADQLSRGLIVTNFTATRNVTPPTGAQLDEVFTGMDVGDSFTFWFYCGAGSGASQTQTGITGAGRSSYAANMTSTVLVTKTGTAAYEWRIL